MVTGRNKRKLANNEKWEIAWIREYNNIND